MDKSYSFEKTYVEVNKKFDCLTISKRKNILTNHIDHIYSIAIWRNKFLFTASTDDKIHIYNIYTSKKIGELPSFGDPVVSLEIIDYPGPAMICFTDLCQRIFLIRISDKKPIVYHDHDFDIMQMLYLRDKKNILFTNTNGSLFSWDFRKNSFHQCLKNEINSELSAMKYIDFLDKIIAISSYSEGNLFLVKPIYKDEKLEDLNLLKKFSCGERICSINFTSFLNIIILGTNDSSFIMLNLVDSSIQRIKLICTPSSNITEIAVIENPNFGGCWAFAVNNCDKKLMIIDLNKQIHYEIYDPFVDLFFFSVKSKIQFFDLHGNIFMALVSQDTHLVLLYEILINLL